MRRSIAFLLAAILLFVTGCQSSFPRVLAVADPNTCVGYPEQRIFLESQVWWNDAGLSIPSSVGEHIHAGACWPVYGTNISGSTLHVDIVYKFHNLAADRITFGRFRVNWRKVGSNGVAIESSGNAPIDVTPGPSYTRDADGNGTAIQPVDIPLSGIPNGTIEMRFNPMAYPEIGRKMFPAPSFQFKRNTNTTSTPHMLGKGWYDLGHEYQNAVFKSPIPTAPLHGNWTFSVGLNPGGGGDPTVEHGIFVDPDFHAGSAGIVIRQRSGQFSGSVTIDTTTLTNGPHKLAILARDANLAGVLVIPFIVAN